MHKYIQKDLKTFPEYHNLTGYRRPCYHIIVYLNDLEKYYHSNY